MKDRLNKCANGFKISFLRGNNIFNKAYYLGQKTY